MDVPRTDGGAHGEELHDATDLKAAAALFASIWSTSMAEAPMSPDLLRALAHNGGYVGGVRVDGRLVGASAGFLARHDVDDELVLHSHITGVAPGAQGKGIGYVLKLHQRAWALDHGLDRITWTFDPLVRRNARFNLNKLGAVITEYHVDFYGAMADAINTGDESDRCVAEWELAARPAAPADEGASVLLCQVPDDIVALRRRDPGRALAWRRALRETLGAAITAGYVATAMTEAGRYVLMPRRSRCP